MTKRKIKRNRLQCLDCGDIIESFDRHDFKWCSCKMCFIDGGTEYVRYGTENRECARLMTEWEEEDEES